MKFSHCIELRRAVDRLPDCEEKFVATSIIEREFDILTERSNRKRRNLQRKRDGCYAECYF